jgi:endoglucanase
MAERLINANISIADGFALNVSNFYTAEENESYGEEISLLIGDKHFIIDTSRSGNGSNGEWCNPSGRKIGPAPTTNTGNNLIDAYLWVKPPGESDGNCNGGPSAGTWWPEYALSLVRN